MDGSAPFSAAAAFFFFLVFFLGGDRVKSDPFMIAVEEDVSIVDEFTGLPSVLRPRQRVSPGKEGP